MPGNDFDLAFHNNGGTVRYVKKANSDASFIMVF